MSNRVVIWVYGVVYDEYWNLNGHDNLKFSEIKTLLCSVLMYSVVVWMAYYIYIL